MPDGTLVRVITLVRGRDAGRPTAVVSGRAERPRVREPRLPTVVASEAVGAFWLVGDCSDVVEGTDGTLVVGGCSGAYRAVVALGGRKEGLE